LYVFVSDKCTDLFTINCVTQCYMFRTLSWFIFRDFSSFNYTEFLRPEDEPG
jgi:hypothetical protein